ncbi:MAG: helix-turn-helix domain-containing protein [Coriobacteriales bacterium]|jgi:AraC family transcriptional regulator of adaptative response / DNA-3-methyladenine glycosylase II|nr:helix-turn-helix domain-containing protein [Coriobacteriales bacterium]
MTFMDDMLNNHEQCYRALAAHDARFDGRIFVGCKTTRIYCRPICRVRLPRPENVDFYPSAAAAEAAGFRPCLKCRPELAPGSAVMDAAGQLAHRAALLMEADPLDCSLEEVAAQLGITARHLRRVFEQEYGTSPQQFLQTRRLLLAKNLLTDTKLPVTEVAYAAGFGSIRRFNDSFKSHYRLSPSRFRKDGLRSQAGLPQVPGGGKANRGEASDTITLLLGYRPPLDFAGILGFLAARTIDGVESVCADSYLRAVRLQRDGQVFSGWLAVRPAARRDALAVSVSTSLLPVLSAVLARLRCLFDLDCQPDLIHEHLSSMDNLRPAAGEPGASINILGVRVPGCFDAFEMATRAILGQQVTVKAARTLANRMAVELGEPLRTPFAELTRTFPSAECIAALPEPVADILGPLGVTGTRARAIRALAEALTSGYIELSPAADAPQSMQRLLELPGFGPWTVQYVAMRALHWPDAFPHGDYGVKLALKRLLGSAEHPPPKQILALAEDWRPWRSYATMNLWKSLSSGE